MSGKSDSILGEPCSMLEGMHFTPILQVFILRELDSMLGGSISLSAQWILMWKTRLYAWKGSINNNKTQINAGMSIFHIEVSDSMLGVWDSVHGFPVSGLGEQSKCLGL